MARWGVFYGELRAAVHPAVRTAVIIKEAVSRRRLIEAGMDLSNGIGAQPNQRVKLAAPTPDGSAATWRCGVVALW